MIELTIEQHASALEDPQSPKRVLDPVSREVFVLMPEKTYEQICQRLIADDVAEIDVGQLIDASMSEYDADDPLLATYQTEKV